MNLKKLLCCSSEQSSSSVAASSWNYIYSSTSAISQIIVDNLFHLSLSAAMFFKLFKSLIVSAWVIFMLLYFAHTLISSFKITGSVALLRPENLLVFGGTSK